jgi:hypothetical protein
MALAPSFAAWLTAALKSPFAPSTSTIMMLQSGHVALAIWRSSAASPAQPPHPIGSAGNVLG